MQRVNRLHDSNISHRIIAVQNVANKKLFIVVGYITEKWIFMVRSRNQRNEDNYNPKTLILSVTLSLSLSLIYQFYHFLVTFADIFTMKR